MMAVGQKCRPDRNSLIICSSLSVRGALPGVVRLLCWEGSEVSGLSESGVSQ